MPRTLWRILLRQDNRTPPIRLAKRRGFSLSKKSFLPAYAGFEITFLPRASRGKKHFYPHKCLRDTMLRMVYAVRAVAQFARSANCADLRSSASQCRRMFRRKPPYGGFSTVSNPADSLSEKAGFSLKYLPKPKAGALTPLLFVCIIRNTG